MTSAVISLVGQYSSLIEPASIEKQIKILNIYRLSAGMAQPIYCERDGRLVVIVKGSWLSDWTKNIGYELAEPMGFLCGMGQGHIFGFGCGQGNEFLFL